MRGDVFLDAELLEGVEVMEVWLEVFGAPSVFFTQRREGFFTQRREGEGAEVFFGGVFAVF